MIKTEEKLKRTPLFDEHITLKAKMVPFGGWEMPVQYSGIIDEHMNVRNKLGLFDVSHMGEFFLKGNDSLILLQNMVPQDISKLTDGKAVYCQLTNEHAGIIDDLIIYKLDKNKENYDFLLIVNASRINEDFNWITSQIGNLDVIVENKSDEYALIALQGPFACDLMQDLGVEKSSQPKRFSISRNNLIGNSMLLSRTGYTGEDGFEILVENKYAPLLWQKLLDAGQQYGIKPIGLGARDTLRLESAMLLYGQDMNESITPVEASLAWSVSKGKELDYNGKTIIFEQLKTKNYDKKLIGFKMLDKSIPRHNYEIFLDNDKIGIVTSGGVAPFIGLNIGLGYINTSVNLSVGSQININIRGKQHPAEIVKRPFYSKSN